MSAITGNIQPLAAQGEQGRVTVSTKTPNALIAACETVGKIAWFGLRVVIDVPLTVRFYLSEIIRQAAILIRSSGLIIWMMMFAIGAETGLQGHYILDQVGASGYVGVFTAIGDLKADSTSMWGWILAAKVGCGYVAELGSMRISDEVDALEVMGVHSRAYLAGSRLVAMWISAPFLFVVGEGIQYFGSWVVVQPMLQTTSPGGYSNIFWSFQTPLDLLYALIWAQLLGTLVVIVGCFYGYTASGGPVDVGRNTAKSMMVNMIVVSACAVTLYQLFFGTNIQTPIGN
ncbi:ABC transporter permease [Actinacidiphila oryziradicis]|uniref:ABC transporter permease n=1 Tax=Actinacidiphila oryziradicis TaxID=2571141 RepID=A0A4U0S1X3_9ACTN|nr:ABC transporter permease [Actinacidiphila oryziradicis]TKA01041.1 ABC transporter permease [Actinacidiphila oryziradicis]TKA04994.1 ABC transporter permease [Actinacidiphila oryziradicis]